MLFSVALSMARRSRGFMPGSPPPRRAATVISLIRRVKILPRFASVAAFLCLMFAHLLWPAMLDFDRRMNLRNYTRGRDSAGLHGVGYLVVRAVPAAGGNAATRPAARPRR